MGEVKDIARGSTKFGFHLYNQLIKPEENAIFSSYSVASVLSMASMGAKGETLKEMKEVLNLPDDPSTLQKAYSSITQLLQSNQDFKLEVANGVFPSKQIAHHEQFLKDAQKYFSSEIVPTDFNKAETASKELNNWVEGKTHGKITDMFSVDSIDPDTASILLNAIYFKGDWLEKFDPDNTSDKPFHVGPNKTIDVPTMFAEIKIATDYNEDLNCDIIALPYKGERITMYILLPKDQFGLRELESKLATDDFDPSIFDGLKYKAEKELHLPKFKLESMHDVKEALRKQGVRHLFDRKCDLSGIAGAPGEMYVSEVKQKAIIEVNEEGSEAAAATAMQVMNYSLVINEALLVDHPFAFMIKDKETGLILFSGRVVNPLG